MNPLLGIGVGLVVVFAVTNGMKDGANVAATAVASQSLSRPRAMILLAAAECVGPFLLGIMVAETVARDIVSPEVLPPGRESVVLVVSGMAGALTWNVVSWLLRLPTSSSFTLVGGLIGPALYLHGWAAVPWGTFLIKVLLAMFLSPILGIAAGYAIFRLGQRLLSGASLKVGRSIKSAQHITLVLLGMNHGTNDSQKAMGIIALLIYLAGRSTAIEVPFWIKAVSVAAITTGVLTGGTKIIRTVGFGIFKIRPLHSLESQISATAILQVCNLLGAPVSTTQIVSSSVIGVGSAFRKRSVRWGIIADILWGWILTIPLSGAVGALFFIILRHCLNI